MEGTGISARIELVLFPVAAECWLQCEKSIDNTFILLVVDKKSRTFFNFPCSANDRVYKSWEGA